MLVISDLHAPFYHKDTIPFLTAIKKLFKPDRIVLIGDECDMNAMNFHEKDPDMAFSPSSELEKAIEHLRPIYELFPKADILESNHGSLVYRRAKTGGIPRHVLRTYREILDAPIGWKWHNDLTIKLSDGQDCFFHHGRSSKGLGVSQSLAMNYVQGHFHTQFEVQYHATPRGVFWAVTTGCMIDDTSLAFAYNKLSVKRPMIGVTIILDGHPKLLPLIQDQKGNWIRKIV